tara:strand:- start:31923 stop:34037 length:2115 start_codon:yes stop_codon:yes gene_type:complete
LTAFLNLKLFFSTSVTFTVVFATHILLAQSDTIQSQIEQLQAIENQENFIPTFEYIDQLNRLGERYYNRNPDSTFLLAMKSLEASEQIDYKKGLVDSYRNIGAYHNIKSEYSQAMSFFREGLTIAEKEQYWLGLANIHNSMGLNAYERGDYTNAVNYYLKALDIKEKHLSKLDQSKTLNNLGLVYMDFGDLDKALKYHSRALKIREEFNDKTGIASSRINIALVNKERGQLDEAFNQFNAALKLGLDLNNRQLISVSYFNIGEILLTKKSFKEALEYFEKALVVDKERGDRVGIGFDLLGIGEAQLNLNSPRQAKKNIIESLNIFVESDIKSNIDKSHLLLSKAYEMENNGMKALLHFKLHKLYQDSVINLETEKQIQEISSKYEFDKKEAELLQSQKEKELFNEKKMERNIRNGVTVILVILLIAFLLAIRSVKTQIKAKALVTRQKNEFENLNKKLLQQKSENEKITNQLFQVNETKDKLFSIVGHDLKSPINSLKGLMQYVVDEKLNQEEFLLVSTQLRNEVEQVHFTLTNLLNWAKGQMRGIVTDPIAFSMHKLLKENINLNLPISEGKNIKIIDRLEENTVCFADKDQINLVMRNILNNALKFTPKGGEIIVSSRKSNPDFWKISIIDNGIGMTDEALNNLFTNDLGGKRQYGTEGEKGTGLGLQLSKDFITKNGGEIKVFSAFGKGTDVSFTLPSAYF